MSRYLLSVGLLLGALAGFGSAAQTGVERHRAEQVQAKTEQDGRWIKYGEYNDCRRAFEVRSALEQHHGYPTQITRGTGTYIVWYYQD